MYTWQLNLTIRNLQKNDFGEYTCTSVNALGKQDARIRLQGNNGNYAKFHFIHIINMYKIRLVNINSVNKTSFSRIIHLLVYSVKSM